MFWKDKYQFFLSHYFFVTILPVFELCIFLNCCFLGGNERIVFRFDVYFLFKQTIITFLKAKKH